MCGGPGAIGKHPVDPMVGTLLDGRYVGRQRQRGLWVIHPLQRHFSGDLLVTGARNHKDPTSIIVSVGLGRRFTGHLQERRNRCSNILGLIKSEDRGIRGRRDAIARSEARLMRVRAMGKNA